MAIGTMAQGGSNDTAGGDDRISIGSPVDCMSSSNMTLSQVEHSQDRHLDDHSQKVLDENLSQEDDGDEERNDGDDRQHQDDSMSSNLSPQSLDEEATSSGGAAAAAVQDKTSDGSSEDNRLNDFANNDNENRDEPFVWTPYAEVHLLNALRGLRPVGANFSFQINIIHGRFEAGMGVYISREELVKKLYTWYNFDEALKICGGEDIPTNECCFSLPEDEFPECVELMKQNKLGHKTNSASGDGNKK